MTDSTKQGGTKKGEMEVDAVNARMANFEEQTSEI
jgi:DNA-directed RNA polymerase beta subunit